MPSIFISYSRKDLNVVLQLEQALLDNSHTVWRDQESLYGGQQWPKTIGEAIASHDFFLLAWSQHAASSHFVEFEWNTALALKKVIVPCLLDKTPLPPALRAINGVFCQDVATGLPRVLQALQQPFPAGDSSHANAVLAKLQTLPAAAPEKVAEAAKTLFAQQNWNVQGNVYQATGDIHVTVATPTEKPEKKLLERWQLWVGLIGGILAIIAVFLEFPEKISKFSASINEETPTTHFTGVVQDSVTKEIIVEAMVIVVGQRRDTVFTTSNGDFSFTKIPGQIGDGVRVYVSKEGYKSHNEYVALPTPKTFYLVKK